MNLLDLIDDLIGEAAAIEACAACRRAAEKQGWSKGSGLYYARCKRHTPKPELVVKKPVPNAEVRPCTR